MVGATKAAVLDVIAQCKREASKGDRTRFDFMAANLISQDVGQPLVMADNLKYWLDRCAA